MATTEGVEMGGASMSPNRSPGLKHSPALEKLNFETSSLLKWAKYAADWKDHRSPDDELSVEEMDHITEEVEYEIELEDGEQIQQDLADFWENDGYDLSEIAKVAYCSILHVLRKPMRAGGLFGRFSIQVLPWNHEKLLKGDPLGECWEASGLCERRESGEGSGFSITLSSSATPSTVMHEVAHVLAFGDEGVFGHGPRWLMYFLILVAGRYWDLDVPNFLAAMHE